METIELTEENRDKIEVALQALLDGMLKLPRHPRGFQGKVEAVDLIVVGRFRDPVTGKIYVEDPVEVQPGQGETPQADLFLRDYALVGTRRGTPLLDVLLKVAPIVTGAKPGGLLDLLELFRR